MMRDLAIYLCLLGAGAVAINAEFSALGGFKHEAAVIAGHMIMAVLE